MEIFEYNNGFIINGHVLDVLKEMDDESIDMVITSPPYFGLRNYHTNGIDWGDGYIGELGQEPHFLLYIDHLIMIFDEVKRILKKEGSCWVNLGDTYPAGGGKAVEQSFKRKLDVNTKAYQDYCVHSKFRSKLGKSLLAIPDRFKIGMIDNGWLCRNEIIWEKPNCLPESVKDRFTNNYEKIFFFVKQKKYYFEQQFDPYDKPMNRWGGEKLKANNESKWDKETGQKSYRERNMRPNPNGKNKRSIWKINVKPFKEAHFAVFPEKLIEVPIISGCPEKGIVLDLFSGSGTTAIVSSRLNREFIGIELNLNYCKISNKRLKDNDC